MLARLIQSLSGSFGQSRKGQRRVLLLALSVIASKTLLGDQTRSVIVSSLLPSTAEFQYSRFLRARNHEAKKSLVGANSKLLLGIFSIKKEKERRKLIRDTYLSHDHDPRICSLADYVQAKTESSIEYDECRVIYSFVVGALDEGPTENLNPKTVALPNGRVPHSERDVIYLNIMENMEDGKTPTWFAKGSLLADEFGFDYIAKADSDTMFDMPKLFDYIDRNLPPKPPAGETDERRIYGGSKRKFTRPLCGQIPRMCGKPLNDGYMVGQFYALSSDLAKYVSTPKPDLEERMIGVEDYDMGTVVTSHPNTVTFALMKPVFWRHDALTKSDDTWREAWKWWTEKGRAYHWCLIFQGFKDLEALWETQKKS